MDIFVDTLAGQTIALHVEASSTVGDVKTKIHEHLGVPQVTQFLISDGQTLETDNTLADYGIQTGSTLQLAVRALFHIRIKFRFNVLTFEVSASDTVGSLKGMIFEKKKIPVAQQRLAFDLAPLDDACLLAECVIDERSLLSLAVDPAVRRAPVYRRKT
eukprot:TRINITY_DN122992_c0_g1_i1.p1 TRINITY_DN122992_c0_g1~~TRINITY_DN122992_c0_g1_i1.p1  ORF type:complete len:159 (+),score=24.53 TRINITY_DN122992_c0_g1_i1:83-559(+)